MGGRVGAVPVLWGALSSENWGSGVLIKKKLNFRALKSASQIANHNGSRDLYLLFSL